ncbi:MAG: T9SS type A sorting domain-containing protein [Ignavibacteriae bacterium]|nr:T9SS type A sorting domain-containing protein [Ignavibacteriota bacterium]
MKKLITFLVALLILNSSFLIHNCICQWVQCNGPYSGTVYSLAVNGNPVILKVYDVMGREVQTLVNESLKPGTYETSFDGTFLNSGVYFYKLQAGDFTDTKKLILIK